MTAQLLQTAKWYLEGFANDSSRLRQVELQSFPFRIGRRASASLCLSAHGVSKDHAEISQHAGRLWIRDVDSRNGTFVNGKRIDRETPIVAGDLLHFANVEFRLGRVRPNQAGVETAINPGATLQVDRSDWILSLGQFEKLFEGGATPHYQPIVHLPQGRVDGYEVLARSPLDGLRDPTQMFASAARLNMESSLSRLFRRRGIEVGQQLPGRPNLFLNTHPAELSEGALMKSLGELRSLTNDPLTLEIHEAAITDLDFMRQLRSCLTELDIQLAYDDFGAGQARLVDLIEVPPDYVKFDMWLVRDIHTASPQRQQTLETLVRMTHDLGVAALAEGVECQAEAEACAQIGFDYAQGYHFGRPADVTHYVGAV